MCKECDAVLLVIRYDMLMSCIAKFDKICQIGQYTEEDRSPNLPEDLCFFKNGYSRLETTSHEQEGYIYEKDKGEIEYFKIYNFHMIQHLVGGKL